MELMSFQLPGAGPTAARRALAVLALLVTIAHGAFALRLQLDSWLQGLVFLCCGAYAFAGVRAMVVWSVPEGAPESSRGRGRDIVLVAQFSGTLLLGWSLIYNKFQQSPSGMSAGWVIATGMMAFALAFHAFPRTYPAFARILEEEFVESEDMPETPPTPAGPDLHRYSHVLQKLRARGYR